MNGPAAPHSAFQKEKGACRLSQVIVIASGKGGTGKTTLCAGLAAGLAAQGRRVLCIDADVGLRNLDLSLGMEDRAVVTFADVMAGRVSLDQAPAHPDIPGLYLLTAPVTESPEALDPAAFVDLLRQTRAAYDWCLIDAPAGIGAGFRLAVSAADRAILAALYDPASLRDAAWTARVLAGTGMQTMHLVVNRVARRAFSRAGITVDDIMDTVSLPLLGLVPEDARVPMAAAAGRPLLLYTDRGAASACRRIARRLEGEHVPLKKRFP